MTIVLNGTTGITNDGGYTGDGVSFADTTPSNTLVTTTGGNVGIGTSSPSAKLHSYAPASTYAIKSQATSTGGLFFHQIFTNDSTEVAYFGSTGSNFGIQTIGAKPLFFTTDGAERMRILPNGAVLIGATAQIASERFRVSGYASIGSDGVAYPDAGTRWGRTSNLIAFTWTGPNLYGAVDGAVEMVVGTTSDYRLKTNNAPLVGSLDVILNLKPITYNSVSFDGAVNNAVTEVGLIAHEVQAVRPSLVTGTKDKIGENGKPTYQSLNYAGLVPDLIKAIQEQQAIITDLKARIETLETSVASASGASATQENK